MKRHTLSQLSLQKCQIMKYIDPDLNKYHTENLCNWKLGDSALKLEICPMTPQSSAAAAEWLSSLQQSVCVPVGHAFFYQILLLGQPPPLYRPRIAASFWKRTLGWLPDFQCSNLGQFCNIFNPFLGLRKDRV